MKCRWQRKFHKVVANATFLLLPENESPNRYPLPELILCKSNRWNCIKIQEGSRRGRYYRIGNWGNEITISRAVTSIRGGTESFAEEMNGMRWNLRMELNCSGMPGYINWANLRGNEPRILIPESFVWQSLFILRDEQSGQGKRF